jgi:DNA-directed RNA polymerase
LLEEDDDEEESPLLSEDAPLRRRRTAHEILLNPDFENSPKHDLEELQLWLECEAQRESVEKYQKVLDSARERGDYGRFGMVQRQILDWYQPLKDAIEAEQKTYLLKNAKQRKDMHRYGPYLCSLQPQKLAVIAAHETILRTVSKGEMGATIALVARKLGEAVEAEVNVQKLLYQRVQGAKKRLKEQRQEQQSDSDVALSDVDSVEDEEDEDYDDYTDIDEDEGEDAVAILNDWMYGSSHLERFVEEVTGSDQGSQKKRLRAAYANHRVRRLLDNTEEWSTPYKVKVGVALLAILLDNATVKINGVEEKAFTYEMGWNEQNKKVGRIILHDAFCKMIVEDDCVSLAATTTRHKPMVVPPKPWSGPKEGGYNWLEVDIMRTHGSKLQKVSMFLLLFSIFGHFLTFIVLPLGGAAGC